MLQKSVLFSIVVVLIMAAVMVMAEDVVEDVGKKPVERRTNQGRPFNLGINIPHIFNMKLLTGADGTGLGIDIPAILRLRLDKGGMSGGRPSGGLFINLFGSDLLGGKRAPLFLRPAADYDSGLALSTTNKKSSKET